MAKGLKSSGTKCCICKALKGSKPFCNSSRSNDGLANICRTCAAVKQKMYRNTRKNMPTESFSDGRGLVCVCGNRMKGSEHHARYCSTECREFDTWQTCIGIIANLRG